MTLSKSSIFALVGQNLCIAVISNSSLLRLTRPNNVCTHKILQTIIKVNETYIHARTHSRKYIRIVIQWFSASCILFSGMRIRAQIYYRPRYYCFRKKLKDSICKNLYLFNETQLEKSYCHNFFFNFRNQRSGLSYAISFYEV